LKFVDDAESEVAADEAIPGEVHSSGGDRDSIEQMQLWVHTLDDEGKTCMNAF
jgi:hypothetical protein